MYNGTRQGCPLSPKFQELSNFKINCDKSEILTINLPKDVRRDLQKEFPFKWRENKLSYLGINITVANSQLYHRNYIPLLNEIKAEVKKMAYLSLSWTGRINIIKMAIIPKINYIFQMLPIEIPTMYLRLLQNILLRFIWQNRK